jgi:hypothetical protein
MGKTKGFFKGNLKTEPGWKRQIEFHTFLNGAFDHYGRKDEHGLQDYRGPLPPFCKEGGLDPCKYSIAIEAEAEKNYVSEKFFDCILCECLPF